MSDLNTEQFAALKAAAEAATPGVWTRDRVSGLDADVRALHADFPHKGYPVALCWGLWKPGSKETEEKRKAQANANAEFIAAANPAAILSLIAEVEAARRAPAAAPAPVAASEKQTDLAKRLLDMAEQTGGRFGAISVLKADLVAICCEANRYYTGMMNWKQAAEAKDAALAAVPAAAPAVQPVGDECWEYRGFYIAVYTLGGRRRATLTGSYNNTRLPARTHFDSKEQCMGYIDCHLDDDRATIASSADEVKGGGNG